MQKPPPMKFDIEVMVTPGVPFIAGVLRKLVTNAYNEAPESLPGLCQGAFVYSLINLHAYLSMHGLTYDEAADQIKALLEEVLADPDVRAVAEDYINSAHNLRNPN